MATPSKSPTVADAVVYFLLGGRSQGAPRPALIIAPLPDTAGNNVVALKAFLIPNQDHGALGYGDSADPNSAGYIESAAFSINGEPGTWCYVADLTDPPHGGKAKPIRPIGKPAPKVDAAPPPASDAATDPPHGG